MKNMFKLVKTNKETSNEFKNKLIDENSRRFLLLLSLVILSQVVFAILKVSRIMEWDKATFISRVVIILVCAIFISLIYYFRRKNNKKRKQSILGLVTSVIQFISILIGCYFVYYMFSDGIYSFSAFLLVAFIVSLTCVRNPFYSGIVLSLFFVGLTAFLIIIGFEIKIWVGELFIALVFIFLLYIGNILNYNRHLKLFLQDKEISRINKRLKEMSQTDELTGIYNRRKIQEVIDSNIAMSKRYKSSFCVAIIDIDHFKRVNDNYGHNQGDVVLKRFSEYLKTELRTTDVLGRWGGEEFLTVLPNCKSDGAYVLLERLRKIIEELKFDIKDKIAFSCGICEYINEESSSELIEKADFALYVAKNTGRNKTEIYDHKMKQ